MKIRLILIFSIIALITALIFQAINFEKKDALRVQFFEEKNALRDDLDDLIDDHELLKDEYSDLNNQLSETYHIFKKGKNYRLKKTNWFKMSTSYMGPLVPQVEEGIMKTEWISYDDINNLLKNAFENIRLIVLEVLDSNSFRNK